MMRDAAERRREGEQGAAPGASLCAEQERSARRAFLFVLTSLTTHPTYSRRAHASETETAWRTGGVKRRRLMCVCTDPRERALSEASSGLSCESGGGAGATRDCTLPEAASTRELTPASASATPPGPGRCGRGKHERREDAASCASTPFGPSTRASRASSPAFVETTPLSHAICHGFFSPHRFPGIRPHFPVCLASRASDGSAAATLPVPDQCRFHIIASFGSSARIPDGPDSRRVLQEGVGTGSVRMAHSEGS
jgi:hypothetical protein